MTITTPGPIPVQGVDPNKKGTSAWANAIYLRSVRSYTTTTQRDANETSPTPGQLCVTADTQTLWQYASATTGWQKPWALPWGVIGVGQATSAQGSITSSYVDLTSMTVSFTAVANRMLQVTIECDILSTVATDAWNVAISNGSGTVQRVNAGGFSGANSEVPVQVILMTPTVVGAMTFKAQAKRSSGTGTLTVTSASGIQPNQLTVVDIGPTGAPA